MRYVIGRHRAGRRSVLTTVGAVSALALLVACSGGSPDGGSPDASGGDEVVLDFQQWWEPELPDGSLRAMMDQFESENPGIKVNLISGPYQTTREQLVTTQASGTMADVVGLDGAWINEFMTLGAITDLSPLMDEAGYDRSQISSEIAVDGTTYALPLVNLPLRLFVNTDLLAQAGISEPPATRSEFVAAAEAISALGGDVSGWSLPLSLEAPNSAQNDVMTWVWASGGHMVNGGQPDLTNSDVASVVDFIDGIYKSGSVSPGSFTQKEQDKVEEFSNGRVGMMISPLVHIDVVRNANPDLNFVTVPIPIDDSYSGPSMVPFVFWGIGISDAGEHKAEAWKLIEFLMGPDVNAELATNANAFPGNNTAVPSNVEGDALFSAAFEDFQNSTPVNEFIGLPVAEELMRSFVEQLQRLLDGQQDVTTSLENAQAAWVSEF